MNCNLDNYWDLAAICVTDFNPIQGGQIYYYNDTNSLRVNFQVWECVCAFPPSRSSYLIPLLVCRLCRCTLSRNGPRTETSSFRFVPTSGATAGFCFFLRAIFVSFGCAFSLLVNVFGLSVYSSLRVRLCVYSIEYRYTTVWDPYTIPGEAGTATAFLRRDWMVGLRPAYVRLHCHGKKTNILCHQFNPFHSCLHDLCMCMCLWLGVVRDV